MDLKEAGMTCLKLTNVEGLITAVTNGDKCPILTNGD